MTVLKKPTEDPIDSLKTCVATSSRDWSIDKRDAWIYGIICGWEESIEDLAIDHGWDAETVSRLQRLHNAFQSLQRSP